MEIWSCLDGALMMSLFFVIVHIHLAFPLQSKWSQLLHLNYSAEWLSWFPAPEMSEQQKLDACRRVNILRSKLVMFFVDWIASFTHFTFAITLLYFWHLWSSWSFGLALQTLILIVCYLHAVVIKTKRLELTEKQAHLFVYVRFCLILVLRAFSERENPAIMTGIFVGSIIPVKAKIRIAFCASTAVINLFHLASEGKDYGVSFRTFIESSCPYLIMVFGILASETMMYAAAIAALESDHTSCMLASFRRVVRGLSDGDVLLDSDFNICGGNPTCLQHILSTRQTLEGEQFLQFLEEEEKEKFVHFMKKSTAEASNVSGLVPCIRVTLETMHDSAQRGSVGVDLFHVPIPRHDAVQTHHLLVLREDVETRTHPELLSNPEMPRLDAMRQGSESPKRHCAFGSASSVSEIVDVYDELVEVTLVLDATSEFLDTEGVHLKFHRTSQDCRLDLGMPSLKRFTRPTDWEKLQRKFMKFATAARVQLPPQMNLGPLCLRLPGESRRYLKAKTAKMGIQQVTADKVTVWLRLDDFDTSQLQVSTRDRFEGIPEHSARRR